MINRFVFIYIILIFSIFSLSSNSQVVWKSDGTIIGSDGEIKKESYGARFQKQLLNPTDDWPKAIIVPRRLVDVIVRAIVSLPTESYATVTPSPLVRRITSASKSVLV